MQYFSYKKSMAFSLAFWLVSPFLWSVTLDWSEVDALPQDSIQLGLQAKEFNKIVSLQFTLEWDTAQIQLLSFQKKALMEGLGFGDTEVRDGILKVSWFDLSGNGISLEEDAILFFLNFIVRACPNEKISIQFSDIPLPIQVHQIINGNPTEINAELNDAAITVLERDLIPIPGDTTLQFGNDLTINVACPDCTYLWDDGRTMAEITITESGFFAITVTDAFQCQLTDEINITVIEDPFSVVKEINFISPNNDGINDQLKFCGLENFKNNKLTIFNRWGKILFETLNYDNSWVGQFKEKDLPAGNYYYVLSIENGAKTIKSTLKIVR